MKQYYTICFCLAINFAVAQHATIRNDPFEFYPGKFPKATLYLYKDSTINGTIMKITDTVLMISVYLSDTSKSSSFSDIAISQIKKIRLKTDIALNMAAGALLGGFVGYGLGYITYSDDASIPEDDNKDKQHLRGGLGALIAAVPGAFVGIFAGLVKKQNYTINGDRKKMRKLLRALK